MQAASRLERAGEPVNSGRRDTLADCARLGRRGSISVVRLSFLTVFFLPVLADARMAVKPCFTIAPESFRHRKIVELFQFAKPQRTLEHQALLKKYCENWPHWVFSSTCGREGDNLAMLRLKQELVDELKAKLAGEFGELVGPGVLDKENVSCIGIDIDMGFTECKPVENEFWFLPDFKIIEASVPPEFNLKQVTVKPGKATYCLQQKPPHEGLTTCHTYTFTNSQADPPIAALPPEREVAIKFLVAKDSRVQPLPGKAQVSYRLNPNFVAGVWKKSIKACTPEQLMRWHTEKNRKEMFGEE